MSQVEKVNPYRDDSRTKDEQVRSMFDSIAPAYDFMNRAMTGGLDRLWLRRLVSEAVAASPGSIIDIATGTGDVAFALARKLPEASITGIDLSEGMLDKARAKAAGLPYASKVSFMQADCLDSGLPDGCADLITVAYGVRNFADIAAGYREMYRMLRPGGKLCVLELSTPVSATTAGRLPAVHPHPRPCPGTPDVARRTGLLLSPREHSRRPAAPGHDRHHGVGRIRLRPLPLLHHGSVHAVHSTQTIIYTFSGIHYAKDTYYHTARSARCVRRIGTGDVYQFGHRPRYGRRTGGEASSNRPPVG